MLFLSPGEATTLKQNSFIYPPTCLRNILTKGEHLPGLHRPKGYLTVFGGHPLVAIVIQLSYGVFLAPPPGQLFRRVNKQSWGAIPFTRGEHWGCPWSMFLITVNISHPLIFSANSSLSLANLQPLSCDHRGTTVFICPEGGTVCFFIRNSAFCSSTLSNSDTW